MVRPEVLRVRWDCLVLVFLFSASKTGIGRELFRSDGTTAGTGLVADVRSGTPSGVIAQTGAVLGTNLIFAGSITGSTGTELLKTDGTAAGTSLVKDIRSGSDGSSPQNFLALNGKVFFIADNGTIGREPWITDGTDAGTILLADHSPWKEW